MGTPATYAESFQRLAEAGVLQKDLADRLVLAVGFRNAIADNYEGLDMSRVYEAATKGPADLRAFLATLRATLVRRRSAASSTVRRQHGLRRGLRFDRILSKPRHR